MAAEADEVPVPNEDGGTSLSQGILNCPPGLEYLTLLDQLFIKEKRDPADKGSITPKVFIMRNARGEKVYDAVEESDSWERNCCRDSRRYEMNILDNYAQEVIHLKRARAGGDCCCPCCLERMEVFTPPGTLVGIIEQKCSCFKLLFSIKNAAGEVVLRIKGPFMIITFDTEFKVNICFRKIPVDVDIKIMSKDGSTELGKISKLKSRPQHETLWEAVYMITFPLDLDVGMKAVMIGACFLIDSALYEADRNIFRSRNKSLFM